LPLRVQPLLSLEVENVAVLTESHSDGIAAAEHPFNGLQRNWLAVPFDPAEARSRLEGCFGDGDADHGRTRAEKEGRVRVGTDLH
jgi:hypothetical protein